MSSPETAFRLNQRQLVVNHVLAGPQRHTCLVGGARSGKTFLFTRAVLTRALRADRSRHAMLRFRGNAARASLWLDTVPKVARICYPGVKLTEHRQDGFLELPNRSEIWIGGLDDKERVEKILGQEYATLYFNEGSQISYQAIQVGLTRLAQKTPLRQRAYYDLNPVGKGHWSYRQFVQLIDPLTKRPLVDPQNYRHEFMNPLDNAENLTPEYLESLANMPERSRRRFFLGEYVEEVEGALWTLEALETIRVEPHEVPRDRVQVVVAVDPSGASGEEDERSDEIGIVVAARCSDGNAYVLADRTCKLSPEGWGREVVKAYDEFHADHVVAERNFGGDMVRYVVQTAARDLNKFRELPVRLVTASRGKVIRAEPVSALYGTTGPDGAWAAGRVRHVGELLDLEEELLNFSAAGYQGPRSPNRADALVWALTDLMLTAQDVPIVSPVIVTVARASPEHIMMPVGGSSSDPTRDPAPSLEDIQRMIDVRGW